MQELDMRGCYEKIRSWCNAHGRNQCQQVRHSAKQRLVEAVIDAMKPAQQMSEVEIYAICLEVIAGNLEIFYRCREEGDTLTMGDYARWAIKQSRLSFPLDEEKTKQLQESTLFEHLSEMSRKIMSGSGMSGSEPVEPELYLSQRLGLDKEFLCHCLEECGNRKEVLCALYDLTEPGGNYDEAIQKLISNGVLTKIARLLSPEIQQIIWQHPAASVLIADLPPPPKPYRRTIGRSR